MKTVFIFINDYNYKLVFTVNAYFTYNVECTAESTPTLRHIVKQKKKKTPLQTESSEESIYYFKFIFYFY